MNEVIHDLDDLKAMIHPGNISYISWGGSLPTKAIEVGWRISKIDDTTVLQKLLDHADVLAQNQASDGMTVYPIDIVQRAIRRRLNELL